MGHGYFGGTVNFKTLYKYLYVVPEIFIIRIQVEIGFSNDTQMNSMKFA